MKQLKLRSIFCLMALFAIVVNAQNNGFKVSYSFDSDLSATVSNSDVITADDAAFGGSKLSGGAVINNQGNGIWYAQVVNNNATNYSNTWMRFDIRPKTGYRLVITNITVKQRSQNAEGNNFFRIGCSQNAKVLSNGLWEFSSPNIAFSKTDFTASSFVPGATYSGASSPEYLSTWITARDESYSTFAWLVDEVTVEGIYMSDASNGAIVVSDVPKQKIDVMGGDMERSGNFIQNASNTSEILDWSITDTKFNFFRVKYDKKQEMDEGILNLSFYDSQIKGMKEIRALNPDIKFLATMKSDYHGYNEGDGNNFPTWIYDMDTKEFNSVKYGRFLADYVSYMYQNEVAIDYITTAKEYVQVVSHTGSHEIVESMKAELAARNIPMPEILAPATWGVSQGISYVNNVKAAGYQDEYYAFSTHNLNGQSSQWHDFVLACEALGKKAYGDETGNGGSGRTTGVEPGMAKLLGTYKEKYEMYRQGLHGEMFFEIWSRGVNSETRPIYFKNGQAGKRMRAYYAMKKFANTVLNKHFVVSNTFDMTDVYSFAFEGEYNYCLWVVNDGDTNYTGIEIMTKDASNTLDYTVWIETVGIEGISGSLNKTGDAFKTSIMGNSLTCFVIPREAITGVKEAFKSAEFTTSVQHQELTVQTAKKAQINIYNIGGQQIDVINSAMNYKSEPLTKGIYVIRVTEENGVTGTKKIVVY